MSRTIKKMNINEAQSKLHSIGPKLKSNLVTDFDKTNGWVLLSSYASAMHSMPNFAVLKGESRQTTTSSHVRVRHP